MYRALLYAARTNEMVYLSAEHKRLMDDDIEVLKSQA